MKRRIAANPPQSVIQHRMAFGPFAFAAAVCLLLLGVFSAGKAADNIEDTQTALEKWIETKRIISKEKHDFALSKEMLNERIELVRREIESLHGKIADAEKSIAEADKKRASLIQENEKLKEASASLGDTLVILEKNLKRFLRRLPDPIRQRIKPLTQRLPGDKEESKLSQAERFQNVVGILNEVDKFNREITAASEVRDLPDGSAVEVTAVYVGLGQAYYAGADGSVAGIGTVSGSQWVWKPENEAAPQIADVIAILKNEKAASFVRIPVEIQ